MSLPMILTRFMAHRFIPILPFTIHLQAITPRGWRSHLELDWRSARHGGAVVGAGGAGGAGTTSTSTTIIISFGTRILTAATATTLGTGTAHRISRLAGMETWAEIPIGVTIRNIVAVLLIGTELPQIGSVVRHAESRRQIARPQPGSKL